MDENELKALALELGFANAELVETGELVFVPSFRPLCEENLCGKYGVNYACPPDCGTVEEMREKVLKWPRALVMQTMWDIEDPMDEEQTKPAKARHNKLTRELIDRSGRPGLMVGASGCSLCSPCAIVEGKPAGSRTRRSPACPRTASSSESWRSGAGWTTTAAPGWWPFSACSALEKRKTNGLKGPADKKVGNDAAKIRLSHCGRGAFWRGVRP